MSDLWLVGAGAMAADYAKVLSAKKVPYAVVGRGEESAKKFEGAFGVEAKRGGVAKALAGGRPERAIVAVSFDELAPATSALLEAGVSRILVEKPAGVAAGDVQELSKLADKKRAQVFVAYNRRFYASVLEAERIIGEDGGVASFHFDFTEWSHVIAPSTQPKGAKENWLLANSSHVIDLAFFLGGRPAELVGRRAGRLDWHPSAARYAGSGKTEQGALFSYQADWEAPGRWGVDLRTRKRRLILQPLEELRVQKLGSTAIEPAPLDDALDKGYKPGLYRQTEAFLSGQDARLKTLAEQARFCADIVGPIERS
jgi:predicted dehydrogenase